MVFMISVLEGVVFGDYFVGIVVIVLVRFVVGDL